MRWRVEVSRQAEEQLSKFPRNIRMRMDLAIDELETKTTRNGAM
jgi:mRNA-degrading endonuclease RelE of RelBE toxin-antitoxin system